MIKDARRLSAELAINMKEMGLMSLLIVRPEKCGKAYIMAAQAFADMYNKITGKSAVLSDCDDGKSTLVIIGSDAVNDFLMNELAEGAICDLGIRYGTDDYCIRTYKKGERNVLVLAGGRGRSTLYAVYGYFEEFMNCRYFWDGDVIPKSDEIITEGIDKAYSPRFFYRGLRYFAHRGLKRFQAEHWSYEDWKAELDWMMKKRLNFFMLRIGMDDAWQRAFPDTVHYADGFYNSEQEVTYTDGYDNRSDFWTAKYRGELRKKVMQYANDLDIMSATDTGTMTHWYSRTPVEFLKKKNPVLLTQADSQYNKYDTGRVLDFRIKENMECYMQLTKTMAAEYDKNNYLFHTIGLGERRMYKDNEKNFRLKKLCYRRIAERIREEFPNSKLMLATWDFVGWWRPEEVRAFIDELDPERTVILDYTSEGKDEIQNFTSWGVVNKFPWIFGLFHAYESESELRGPYERSDERLRVAANDPYCKGMILWPELSHSDPLILEYLAQSSWSPLENSIEEMTRYYSLGRYGSFGERMNACWQAFLPFMKLSSWGGYTRVETPEDQFRTDSYWCTHSDIFVKPAWFIRGAGKSKPTADYYEKTIEEVSKYFDALPKIIDGLAEVNAETEDVFIRRDSVDIVRTVCGRFLNYILAKCTYGFGKEISITEAKKHYLTLMGLLSQLLWHCDDFSVNKSFEELSAVAPINPDFEAVLKDNLLNEYCSQYCAELVDNVFIEEGEAVFDYLAEPYEIPALWENSVRIFEKFKNTPIEKMKKQPQKPLADVMREISVEVKAFSGLLY